MKSCIIREKVSRGLGIIFFFADPTSTVAFQVQFQIFDVSTYAMQNHPAAAALLFDHHHAPVDAAADPCCSRYHVEWIVVVTLTGVMNQQERNPQIVREIFQHGKFFIVGSVTCIIARTDFLYSVNDNDFQI